MKPEGPAPRDALLLPLVVHRPCRRPDWRAVEARYGKASMKFLRQWWRAWKREHRHPSRAEVVPLVRFEREPASR